MTSHLAGGEPEPVAKARTAQGRAPRFRGITVTSPASGAFSAADLPDGVCQSKFLTTRDGVVLSDVPPSVGHNLPKEPTQAILRRAG
jgi:hypothetical protein